ncbi:MAG: hypothetical protein ACE5I7_19005, partial [Candidatus Binatia bacterium]
MIYVVADVSTACCTVAGLVGCAQLARARRISWSSAASVAAFVVLATWAAMVAVYARAPLSPLRAHALLTALCLASAPWLAAALSVRERHISAIWGRWKVYLVTHAGVSGCAALVMWFFGVDWITGIGSEPTVVLTGWGLLAASASAASSFVALMVLGAGLPAGVGSTPALLLGMVGATGSVLWVSAGLLWRGYLTLTPLISAVALGAVAALMWTVGLVRDLPAGASIAPSRRLVYGASALSIVLAYILAARVAFEWIAALARNAVPAILP